MTLCRWVSAAGRAYGLELPVHEDKFQLLQVGCRERVLNTNRRPVTATTSLTYLGATLASDGRVGSELSRRIGAAKGDFRNLCKVWRHSSLTTARKLDVYRALVESKLMYALCTGTYTKAELRRLDGFQAKCLRSILSIAPSQYSRVSNEAVREKAALKSASKQLREQQLIFLGKVLRSDLDSVLQTVSFTPGTMQPTTCAYIRRVGRPRKEWIAEVLPEALRLAGGEQNLRDVVQRKAYWKRLVKKGTA